MLYSKNDVYDPLSGNTYRIRGYDNAAQAQITFATNQANLDLAKQQNDWNVQQWQRENDYNSPANQIRLLQEAGLNPNLYSGQGMTAGELRSADMSVAASPQLTSNDVARAQTIMDAIGQGINLGNSAIDALAKRSQMEKLRADIAESQQRQRLFNDTYPDLAVRPQLENGKLAADTAKSWSDHGINQEKVISMQQQRDLAKEMWKDTHKLNGAQLLRMKEELRGIKADSDIKQFEARFRKEFGIDPKADWPSMLIELALSQPGSLERVIGRVFGSVKQFLSPQSWYNALFGK